MDTKFKIVGDQHVWSNDNDSKEWKSIGDAKSFLATTQGLHFPKVIDTETTGLNYFLHKAFSLAFKFAGECYYMNLKGYDGIEEIKDDWVVKDLEPLKKFLSEPSFWIGHNLKFDWHIIYTTFGVKLTGQLWDTMVIERLLSNDEMRYNLAVCVERNVPGYEKDEAVEEYIDKNGLYSTQQVFGKKKQFTEKYYHLVPFSLIAPYAARDVDVTERLFLSQCRRIEEFKEKNEKFGPKLQELVNTENKLLAVCCDVERRGVMINPEFCEEGLAFEYDRVKEVAQWFRSKYQKEFIDSVEFLAPILQSEGVSIGSTDKGNLSIKEDVLSASANNELAGKILIHREASKRADTYFQSFIHLSKADGCLHPDMKQAGTRTGRFSYADPNLQNVPAEDESKFPIRRALIPRKGYFFFMPDYKQMELRMMLDYAGQMNLINKILEGHDPHQATADLTGLTRKAAKNLNFGLLYGMGLAKLGTAIGVSYDEAKAFKWKYFAELPQVKNIIYQCTDIAKSRGFLYTWAGRKLDFPNRDFAYKGINGVIQGGCADVVKKVITNLFDKKEKLFGAELVMQVHDELLFEVPLHDTRGMKFIVDTMESVYPYKFLPLTVGLCYSLQSFHDGIETTTLAEIDEAIGKELESKSEKVPRFTSENMVSQNQ